MKKQCAMHVGLAILGILDISLAHAGLACQVQSGPATAALVELYTSEGCSSCPPADNALRALRTSATRAVVIPLALHVSYWDQIGWKDTFAQKTFDARQSALVINGGGKIVYTPQFFINGRELRHWSNALPDAINQINKRPAAARITLKSTPIATSKLLLEAAAVSSAAGPRLALFVALSESELVSHVTRGENSGVTLHHDDTVRSWIGPIMLSAGNAQLRKEIPLSSDWNPDHLHAVAFVQDLDDGSILQAVSSAHCAPSRHS